MKGFPGHRFSAAAPAVVLPLLALVVVTVVMSLGFIFAAGSTPARALVPLPDYNEPNDDFSEATALENGATSYGAITTKTDEDYFYLDLDGPRLVTVDFTTGGYQRECKLCFMALGGDTIVDIDWEKSYDDDGSFHAQGTLGPGRLFAVVSAGRSEPNTLHYTVTVTAGGGGPTTFPDVPAGSDYYAAISFLAGEGVVSGFKDGTFGPDNPVTRQQFAKMIVRAVGYWVSPNDTCPFRDVEPSLPGHYLDANDPLYPDHYVAVAAVHGITVGVTATTFRPDHKITMAQVVSMVVRTAEDKGIWDSPPSAYQPPFADFGPPHYANARIGAAHGLFTGYNGPWNWTVPATRGQCAFFIWRLMLALG